VIQRAWIPDLSWITAERISAGASALGAAGLIAAFVALLYTRTQIKEARKERIRSLASDLSQRWDSSELLKARHFVMQTGDELSTKMQELRQKKELLYLELLREPNYLEDLGALWKNSAIEVDIIRDSLGDTLLTRWELWEPFVQWLRDQYDDQSVFHNFELLAVAVSYP